MDVDRLAVICCSHFRKQVGERRSLERGDGDDLQNLMQAALQRLLTFGDRRQEISA